MADWFDSVGDFLQEGYDWLMTDSDGDGNVDWSMQEILPGIGESVGETFSNVVSPVASSMTMPLVVAGGIALLVLGGSRG